MKVMCPKCGHLIETRGDKNIVFCSECSANFELEQGKKIFERQYGALTNQAFTCLTQKGDYDRAIDLYEQCLTIVENDLQAIIGIALATLYKQDFKNLNFDKIIPIIDKYEISLNAENTFLFLTFVEDVIKETNKYLREANERLFKDGKCLSREYLNNYEKSLDDILGIISYFRDGIALCSEEEKNTFFEETNLNEQLDKLENKVKEFKEIHHEVLNNEEELSDNRIIIIDTKSLKIYRLVMGVELVFALLLIIFLILGVTINVMFYYFMIIPFVIGAIVYIVYYQKFLKGR